MFKNIFTLVDTFNLKPLSTDEDDLKNSLKQVIS